MGAFFCRRDAQGTERWWLEVTGKGNKTRLVPATDELIAELARYRRAHGLPATPQPGETRPLVLPVIGRDQGRDKALSRARQLWPCLDRDHQRVPAQRRGCAA
ncbi:hypothetical protein RM96_31280 [Cupriavidus sp. IDO]|nr:hypothetical protein RM96_31280 [Cupriavidus sp. IDO]